MISAVNNCNQRWETKAAPWSHVNEGKKMFSLFESYRDALHHPRETLEIDIVKLK